MKLTDEQLERRMLRQFRRHGGESAREGLFEALDSQSQARVSSFLDQAERPVLAGRGRHGGLLVATTRRLLLMTERETRSLEVSDVRDVSVDLIAEVARGHRNKKDWRTLVAELTSGEKISFAFREGVSFWGFLNAVK